MDDSNADALGSGGGLAFNKWGEMTDGIGTAWCANWFDLLYLGRCLEG